MSRPASARIHIAQHALEHEHPDWGLALLLDEQGRLFLKNNASIRSGDGLFGPNTLFINAGQWLADGHEEPGTAALEINPVRVLAIVERK